MMYRFAQKRYVRCFSEKHGKPGLKKTVGPKSLRGKLAAKNTTKNPSKNYPA